MLKKSVVDLSRPVAEDIEPMNSEPPQREVKTGALDFIIISGIFLIFLLSPLFFTGLAAAGIGFEKIILFFFLVLASSAAWAAKAVVNGGLKLKKTPLDWPIAGILAVSVISTIMSVNQKVSLLGSYGNLAKGLAALIIFIMFYYLLVNNVDVKRIKMLFWAFVASSSLIIFYSLLQLLGVFLLPVEFAKTAGFNPIGSLSGLSMFIAVVLPVLVLAAAQTEKNISGFKEMTSIFIKFLTGAAALAGIAILVFLNGITFWPAAIAGIAVMLLFLLSRAVSISNKGLVIPVGAFLLLVIFLVLGNFSVMDFGLPGEVRLSRGVSWDIAKDSVKDNPIFGSGPSTFYYSFSKFKGAELNDTPFWNTRFSSPSGFLFELLADVGILGALAVIIALIAALYAYYRAVIKTKSREIKLILLSLFSSFIVILILSSLFPFSNSLILISVLIAALAASAAFTQYENVKEIDLSLHSSARPHSPRPRGDGTASGEGDGRGRGAVSAAVFLAVSAGVIAAFVFGAKMYVADFYAREALAAKSLDVRISKLEKAIKFASYQDVYYVNLADSYIALVNQETAAGKDKNRILTNLNQAVNYARTAVEIAPEKYVNNEFLALVYENASAYTDGGITVWAKMLEDLYGKAIELEPNSPIPYFKLALLNAARANATEDGAEKEEFFKAAIEKYDLAIAKKGDLAIAYYGKGVVYEKMQNVDDAINQLTSAVNESGNNIDYMFELGRLYFNRGIARAKISEPAAKSVKKETVKNEEGEEASEEEVIVETVKTPLKKIITRNEDIDIANQIFLNILKVKESHANSLYSLAMIYNAVGENDNAKIAVKKLLAVLQDEQQKNKVREEFKDVLR